MPYLIDGHNLIGKLPDVSLDDPHDEAKLVQKLLGFVARTRRKCVVVFDHGIPSGRSKMSTRGVQVIFASPRERADDVIMRRIKRERNPRKWVVVSSDNQVLNTARHYRMSALNSIEFVDLLRQPTRSPQPDRGEAADIKLSDDEVQEWLYLFNNKER